MVKLPAIVLAAGGPPGGQVLRSYQGKTLLTLTLENLARYEGIERVVLVTGANRQTTEKLAEPFPRCTCVYDPSWEQGLASSLQVGLDELGSETLGTLLLPGDTPFFQKGTMYQVFPSDAEVKEIRIPTYQGKPGHPMYLPVWFFKDLRALKGDEQAKSAVKPYRTKSRVIKTEDPGILQDFSGPIGA